MKDRESLYLLSNYLLDLRTVPWALQALIYFILTPSFWINCYHVRDEDPGAEMRGHSLKVIRHTAGHEQGGDSSPRSARSSPEAAPRVRRPSGRDLTARGSAISLTGPRVASERATRGGGIRTRVSDLFAGLGLPIRETPWKARGGRSWRGRAARRRPRPRARAQRPRRTPPRGGGRGQEAIAPPPPPAPRLSRRGSRLGRAPRGPPARGRQEPPPGATPTRPPRASSPAPCAAETWRRERSESPRAAPRPQVSASQPPPLAGAARGQRGLGHQGPPRSRRRRRDLPARCPRPSGPAGWLFGTVGLSVVRPRPRPFPALSARPGAAAAGSASAAGPAGPSVRLAALTARGSPRDPAGGT